MFKKQITVNIKELDLKIAKLNEELEEIEDDDDKYDSTMDKMKRLTELRCKLFESKNTNSVKPLVVTGLFGIASTLVVLYYEDKEVIITSKAFNIATSMFRGGK